MRNLWRKVASRNTFRTTFDTFPIPSPAYMYNIPSSRQSVPWTERTVSSMVPNTLWTFYVPKSGTFCTYTRRKTDTPSSSVLCLIFPCKTTTSIDTLIQSAMAISSITWTKATSATFLSFSNTGRKACQTFTCPTRMSPLGKTALQIFPTARRTWSPESPIFWRKTTGIQTRTYRSNDRNTVRRIDNTFSLDQIVLLTSFSTKRIFITVLIDLWAFISIPV